MRRAKVERRRLAPNVDSVRRTVTDIAGVRVTCRFHAIVEIPVFLWSGPVSVPVELQLRSIAMDFWASLEHARHRSRRA